MTTDLADPAESAEPAESARWRPAGPGDSPDAGATVAGGDGADPAASVPPVGDALRVEGPASGEGAANDAEPNVTAWVFRSGAAPRRVGLADLPDLVADDATVAWVDVAGHVASGLRPPLLSRFERTTRPRPGGLGDRVTGRHCPGAPMALEDP